MKQHFCRSELTSQGEEKSLILSCKHVLSHTSRVGKDLCGHLDHPSPVQENSQQYILQYLVQLRFLVSEKYGFHLISLEIIAPYNSSTTISHSFPHPPIFSLYFPLINCIPQILVHAAKLFN